MKEIQLSRIDLNLLVVFESLMVEGSVIGAADRLAKTPSAISHALQRLRDQLGDPLMVKVGGRMQPSPFAIGLIDEVRPILRSIKRIMALPQPFDPAISDRVFRLAIPAFPAVMAAVLSRVHAVAPNVKIEWMLPNALAYPAVAEGQFDLAHLGGETRLPEGLEEAEMPPFRWATFLRKDHPARANWGLEAWQAWPHLQVNIANTVRSPLETQLANTRISRRIGALISEFASVGPLLSRTNLLGTFPDILLASDMAPYGLHPMPTPIAFPPFRVRFFWSARLASDPGSQWIRGIVLDSYAQAHHAAQALVVAANGDCALRD